MRLGSTDSGTLLTMQARIDRPLVRTFGQFAALRGTVLYNKLRRGTVVYRAFVFQNSAAKGAGA